MHVQPVSLDIFGHDQKDFGTKIRYFLTNIASAQAKAGDLPEIHLLSSGKQEESLFENIRVYYHKCYGPPRLLGFEKVFARQISPSLLSAIGQTRADVIHFSGVLSYQLMLAAVIYKANKVNIPVIASEQGGRTVRFIEKKAQQYALRNADAITACTREAAENLKSLGARPDVHVVPNGVDEEKFYPGPARTRKKGDPLKILVGIQALGRKRSHNNGQGSCHVCPNRPRRRISL